MQAQQQKPSESESALLAKQRIWLQFVSGHGQDMQQVLLLWRMSKIPRSSGEKMPALPHPGDDETD